MAVVLAVLAVLAVLVALVAEIGMARKLPPRCHADPASAPRGPSSGRRGRHLRTAQPVPESSSLGWSGGASLVVALFSSIGSDSDRGRDTAEAVEFRT